MKLISIKLCNFRQFYGKTPEINLASGKNNTTVIHGNNGAGKTTLLNAFTWVLYEKFTAAFVSPDSLINKRSIAEAEIGASIECWVEIQFEHENKRYQLKRKCYASRQENGQTLSSDNKLFMLVAGDDGRWYPPLQHPEDIINRILPESLHQYFFFDGEHIDRIFRTSEKNSIAEDTKELLGVKVLDRAIEHLKKAKRTLQEELKVIGDPKTKQLLQTRSQLENERVLLTQVQCEITEQLDQYEIERQNITQHLLALSGFEETKQLKENLDKQSETLRQNLLDSHKTVKQIISTQSYVLLLPEIIAKFYQIIDDLRQNGELPAGIKQQFVSQLLERKRCICGTELEENTTYYREVKEWMNRAGIADVEEEAIRLESKVSELENRAETVWRSLDTEETKINEYRLQLAQIENQSDEIVRKFRHYPDEDIQLLQQQVDRIEESCREIILERGINQNQLENLQKELEDLDRQVIKHKLKEEKQALAQRRIQVTQEAVERLIEVRTRLENQFCLSLEQKVREIFHSISFTPYFPRLSHEYELTLVENTTGISNPVAASTGENQILSLSFIGAIIDRVREWSKKNTLMGPDSSTFPIVMDSPFGSLDEIYRRQVAKSLPQLANQLIILVTKTQWRTEVETETSDYLGKEYVLVYYSPKADCQEDSITLRDVEYPLVKRSPNQFEYTEILEVSRRSDVIRTSSIDEIGDRAAEG